MIGKATMAWTGLILLAGIFIAVFTSVLEMRLAKGDIYPHYATFRNDPLGASGLYEAFGKIPEYTVRRNVESLMKVDGLDGDTALLLLGMPRSQFSRIRVPDDSPVLEAVEKQGARLILTIDPVSVPSRHLNTLSADEDEWLERRKRERESFRKKVKEGDKEKEEKTKTKKEKREDDKVEMELERTLELGPRLESRFGIYVADVKAFDRPDAGWPTQSGESIQPGGVTKDIPVWKSQYRFELEKGAESEWKMVATVEGEAVVVERRFGKGSVVFATDSHYASNEALNGSRNSEFLLWLTGGKQALVFDETMHGSVESMGAMKLLRQFRLHGFMIGLLVVVALWAWKSSSSLSPGDESTERGLIGAGGAISGADSKSGFTHLLQRSIPVSELIENCLATWTGSHFSSLSNDQEQKISELTKSHQASPRTNNAVSTYQKIAEILRRR